MRFLIFVWLVCLFPASALAGAWPREAGSWFLSQSYTARGDRASLGTPAFVFSGFSSLYVEYGMTPKLTLGLDAFRADAGDYSAIAFARYPVVFGLVPGRLAVQAGAGLHSNASFSERFVQLGVNWGTGLDTRFGPGWLALDTQLHYRLTSGDVVRKADLTLGVKPDARTKLMLQLQSGLYPGADPYLRFAPSVARKINGRQHIELGVEADPIGGSSVGLKLGTWLEF